MSLLDPDYSDFLVDIGRVHPEVLVLDAGLATSTPTNKFAAAFPQRYFNLGIAEQNIVGLASGLARRGFIPIVHSFSNFLTRRAHDQIAVSVAWPLCQVKLIGCSCGVFDGKNGPSHMAIDDLATMIALPGMFVAEPGDLVQTKALLSRAVEYPGPAYLRLRRHNAPVSLATGNKPEAGTSTIVRNVNSLATIVAGGTMLDEAIRAVELLLREGVPVDLIHVSVLRPFEPSPIIDSVRLTGTAITIENHVASGGFGDMISRLLGPLGVVLHRLALPDAFPPSGSPGFVLRACGLNAEAIADTVQGQCNTPTNRVNHASTIG